MNIEFPIPELHGLALSTEKEMHVIVHSGKIPQMEVILGEVGYLNRS